MRYTVRLAPKVFYIRTGNATNALNMSELLDYCKHRWPEGLTTSDAVNE